MSKELIEQLRELSASRKPYATGAHGQIIGMESYRIVTNGFALECIDEAADRIEELERRLEKALDILGADTQIDAEANFVALRQELDAMQADNAKLVAALEDNWNCNPCETTRQQKAFDVAQSVLAKVRKPT